MPLNEHKPRRTNRATSTNRLVQATLWPRRADCHNRTTWGAIIIVLCASKAPHNNPASILQVSPVASPWEIEMLRLFMRARLSGLVVAAVAHLAGADTIYVDASAGAGDGTSWESAYGDLQAALAAANPGDEIWVRAGIYVPSPTGDATTSFHMRSGVALYGGFNGTESLRSQRDFALNQTTLSGDVNQDDVGVDGAWPSNWNVTTSNCGHVVVSSGVDRTAVLDGFIIELGHTGPVGTPAGDPLMYGSGLYNVGGSPTVRNCTFRHNLAAFAHGGAVFTSDGSPAFNDCVFQQNYVHLGSGGGLYAYGSGAPVIEDCQFLSNQVVAYPESTGAGVSLWNDDPTTIRRCVFDSNINRPFYSVGDYTCWGGGLNIFYPQATVIDCAFRNNRAHYGAGLMTWKDTTIVNCLIENNTATVQPRDPYPEGGGEGAALAVYSFAGATATIINCDMLNNHGKKHALTTFASGHLDVANSIIWGNTATHPEVTGYYRTHIAGAFSLDHCCVALIFGPAGDGEDTIDPADLPGCIDSNPMLAVDDTLLPGSPCIDAGTNSAIPAGVILDLAANPRRTDDPATGDTGSGAAPIVDMGVYEVVVANDCAVDFNADGSLDFFDVQSFLAAFASRDPAADFNHDDAFDFFDVQSFLAAFAAGCP